MSLKRRESMTQSCSGGIGGGLRVAADDPHLVSLGGGRLSTAVTIHQLPVGDTTIGSSVDCSIVLSGSGVLTHHCTLHRTDSGSVSIHPQRDARVLLDGKRISSDSLTVCGGTPLSQGVMITIGKSNYLRFNHPAEAELMRSTIGSNERISMPPIDFAHDSTSSGSGGSSTDGSPCEMLRSGNGDSPTPPPSGSSAAQSQPPPPLLAKMNKSPAFGSASAQNMNNFHSPKVFAADSVTVNAPAKDVLGAKFNNFTKNLTQMFGKNEKNAAAAGQQNQQRKTSNDAKQSNVTVSSAAPVSTAHAQAVVTSPKVPQQFSACYDRYPKPGSYGSLQVFPMNNVNTEMNTDYQTASATSMTTSETVVAGSGLTELQRQRAQIERMQEEQISKMEHDRLEEILKMCADFERQHETSSSTIHTSPIVQNRIKTNGSLPREKKPSPTNGHTSAGSAAVGSDAAHTLFFPSNSTGAAGLDAFTATAATKPPPKSGYENVHIGNGRQVHLDASGGGGGAVLPSPPNGYENVNGPPPPSPARKPIGYVPQSPRTKIKTCASPKREQQQQPMSMSMHATSASQRAEYDALVQSFEEKLRLEIQMLRENRSTAAQATTAATPASAQPEPVYGTLDKRPTRNVNNLTVQIAANKVDHLRAERLQVLQRVRELRARIAELQQQDEELMRGLDMEKALVTAELSTERTHLQNLQRNIATLQSKIQRIETQRAWNRTAEEQQQHKLKLTIEKKQAEVEHLGSLLAQRGNDESVRSDLNATMDDLETHSKCYEDLEFHCFEEEAEWSALHEELLNDLRSLRKMSIDKERHIGQLQVQCTEATAEMALNDCSGEAATAAHSPSVERELRAQLSMLKQQRVRLRSLDAQLYELTGQKQQPATNSESDEDDDDEDSVLLTKTGCRPAHSQPLMSQSLFGSQEILAASRQTIAQQQRADLDLMSRSVNENMFLRHHNIESRTPFTSTPKRRGDSDGAVPLRSVDISEDITRLSQNGHEQLRRAELQQQQLLDVDDGATEDGAAAAAHPMTALKYNLSPPFQHKKPASAVGMSAPPLTPTSAPADMRCARAQKASTLNLSIESDDFEVNPLERRVPSQDDIDRISKITLDAPISTQGASYKVIESIKEIERNRQLLLKQQGSHVIEHERQKMHELKKKSHDEARAQYMQQSQSSAMTAAAAALAVTAEATPNGSGDNVDERDSYVRKDCSLETVQPNGGTAAVAEELKLTPLAGSNNNAQHQLRTSTGSGIAINVPNGNKDANSSSSSAINNNKSPKSETPTSPHRHSQPDFERVRPLSDANSELSYDILAEKPFKSTTDMRLSSSRLHENGNNGGQHQFQQYQQQQHNHQQGHSSQYYQQQQHQHAQHHAQQRFSQTSHDSNGSGNGTDGTEDQFQQQTSTQQQHRSLVAGSKRNLPKHQRPLTRYLPIMSLDLDLRQHIESAGHQVTLCPHVLLDAHSCRGYLHKLGATFHGWSRRWFLFDRQKMALIYFSDKSERKPRGGAYFSTIDEVYLDHMNTSKSGRPYCTFIVKTKKRSYHLQAASDAAARIWIDAIITGAQGNIDY